MHLIASSKKVNNVQLIVLFKISDQTNFKISRQIQFGSIKDLGHLLQPGIKEEECEKCLKSIFQHPKI